MARVNVVEKIGPNRNMSKPSGLRAFRGQKVGLLGGSFNPAHAGHLHIVRLAIKYLNLSKIWCLVSPQNPLKSVRGMAPVKKRLLDARKVFSWPSVIVTDIETSLLTSHSVDTIKSLKKLYPGVKFVWIMGADNLIQINQWYQWELIFQLVPIAVFDRPPYSLTAETSVASRRFSGSRISSNRARDLVNLRPPAWVYLRTKLNPLSGTQIRKDVKV